mmetsp:Transcript_5439/g.13424  ORF Transcript_5439/g.13424 Transcript_5439/m.13424 type:complete len:249 (+) Transcript_5439:905-1651(+)
MPTETVKQLQARLGKSAALQHNHSHAPHQNWSPDGTGHRPGLWFEAASSKQHLRCSCSRLGSHDKRQPHVVPAAQATERLVEGDPLVCGHLAVALVAHALGHTDLTHAVLACAVDGLARLQQHTGVGSTSCAGQHLTHAKRGQRGGGLSHSHLASSCCAGDAINTQHARVGLTPAGLGAVIQNGTRVEVAHVNVRGCPAGWERDGVPLQDSPRLCYTSLVEQALANALDGAVCEQHAGGLIPESDLGN